MAPLPGPPGAGPGASCSPRGVAPAGTARQALPLLPALAVLPVPPALRGPVGRRDGALAEAVPAGPRLRGLSAGRLCGGAPLPPLQGLFLWPPASDVGKSVWGPRARGPALRREGTLAAFIMGPGALGSVRRRLGCPCREGVLTSRPAPGLLAAQARGLGQAACLADPDRGRDTPRCTPGGRSAAPRLWSPLRPAPRARPPPPLRLGGDLLPVSWLRFANAPSLRAATSFLASRDSNVLV